MKRFVIGICLVFALVSSADAQLFCRGGQCRIGVRAARVVTAPVRAFQSCSPQAYQATSCCAQEVQYVGVIRRGIFQRLRDRRAARLSARSCTYQAASCANYAQASCADYSGYSSVNYVEPAAATIEDTGVVPSYATDDAPTPPVPSLSAIPQPISLAVL